MNRPENISKLKELMKTRRIDCTLIVSLEHTYPDIYYYTGLIDLGMNILITTRDDAILYSSDSDKAKRA